MAQETTTATYLPDSPPAEHGTAARVDPVLLLLCSQEQSCSRHAARVDMVRLDCSIVVFLRARDPSDYLTSRRPASGTDCTPLAPLNRIAAGRLRALASRSHWSAIGLLPEALNHSTVHPF
jgi:hypothetical protein